MVVGAFPAAKLGALLLRQISKPIASVVKEQAKNSPIFRKYVCMPPAQFYNWCEVKAKMWILNLGKPVNIPVLNEAMAIELGANLLGEGIIFIIAAGVLISEYNRSARKEAAKEESKLLEMNEIHNSIRELYIQSEEQGAQIRELSRKLGHLDTILQDALKDPKLSSSPSNSPQPRPSPPNTPQDMRATRRDLPLNSNNLQELSYYRNANNSIAVHPTNLISCALDDLKDQFWGRKG